MFFNDFYRSLDGLLFKRKRNAHIPLWNYTVFRFQVGNSSNIKSHRTHQIQWMHQSLCWITKLILDTRRKEKIVPSVGTISYCWVPCLYLTWTKFQEVLHHYFRNWCKFQHQKHKCFILKLWEVSSYFWQDNICLTLFYTTISHAHDLENKVHRLPNYIKILWLHLC